MDIPSHSARARAPFLVVAFLLASVLPIPHAAAQAEDPLELVAVTLEDNLGSGLFGDGDCEVDTFLLHFSHSLDYTNLSLADWSIAGVSLTGASPSPPAAVELTVGDPFHPFEQEAPAVSYSPGAQGPLRALSGNQTLGGFSHTPTEDDAESRYQGSSDFLPCSAVTLDRDGDDNPDTVRFRFRPKLAWDDGEVFSLANSDADLETIRRDFTMAPAAPGDVDYGDASGHPLGLLRPGDAPVRNFSHYLDMRIVEPATGYVTNPGVAFAYNGPVGGPSATPLYADHGGRMMDFGAPYLTAFDGVRPLLLDVRAVDGYNDEFHPSPDGHIDSYELDFSEAMNPDTFRLSDWTVPGVSILRVDVLEDLRTFRLVMEQDEQLAQDDLPDLTFHPRDWDGNPRTCNKDTFHDPAWWEVDADTLAHEGWCFSDANGLLVGNQIRIHAPHSPPSAEGPPWVFDPMVGLPRSGDLADPDDFELTRSITIDVDGDEKPDYVLLEFNSDVRDEDATETSLVRTDWSVPGFGDASQHPRHILTHVDGFPYRTGVTPATAVDDRFLFLKLKEPASPDPDAMVPVTYSVADEDFRLVSQRGVVFPDQSFTATDGIAPKVVKVEAIDAASDGLVEAYKVHTTEDLKGSSIRLQGWALEDGTPFTSIAESAGIITLNVHPDHLIPVGSLPFLAYAHPPRSSGSTPATDLSGNVLPAFAYGDIPIVAPGGSIATDVLHVTRAIVRDLDDDGHPDTVALLVDRDIQGANATHERIVRTDWVLGGGYGDADDHPVSLTLGASTSVRGAFGFTASQNARLLVLTLNEGAVPTVDSQALGLTVSYAPPDASPTYAHRIQDAHGRVLEDFAGLMAEEQLPPRIIGTRARDLLDTTNAPAFPGDGLLDHVDVDFSEPLVTGAERKHWRIAGVQPLSVAIVDGPGGPSTVVRLRLNAPVDPGEAAGLVVDYLPASGVQDGSGNFGAGDHDLEPELDVPPFLLQAVAIEEGGRRVMLRFNVGVTNASGAALSESDFDIFNGSRPAVSIASVAHTAGARLATLTLSRGFAAGDDGNLSVDGKATITGDDEAEVGPAVPITLDAEAPAAVSGLAVVPVGTTQLRVTWSANNEPDLSHYELVYREVDGGSATTRTVQPSGDSEEEHVLTGLTPITTYALKVRGVDLGGKIGPDGAEIEAVTDPDATPPETPSLHIVPGSLNKNGVRINWDEVSDTGGGSVAGYEARLAMGAISSATFDDGTEQAIASIAGGRHVQLAGLTAGTAYALGVQVRDDQGNTAFASIAFNTPAATATTGPLGLTSSLETGTPIAKTDLQLTWTPQTDTFYRYTVTSSASSVVALTDTLVNGTHVGALSLSLAHGDRYVHVAAFGPDPEPVQETLHYIIDVEGPPAPSDLSLVDVDQGRATLEFTIGGPDPASALSFDVVARDVQTSTAPGLTITDLSATATTVSMSLNGLQTGKAYDLTVAGIDPLGNKGAASDALRIHTDPDTTPPVGRPQLRLLQDGTEVDFVVGDEAELRISGARDDESDVEYRYLMGPLADGAVTLDDPLAAGGRIQLKDLQPGTRWVEVRAFSEGGAGEHAFMTVEVSAFSAGAHEALQKHITIAVERTEGGNRLRFSYPAAQQQPAGFELWSSNSPYTRMGEVLVDDAADLAGERLDAGAPEDTGYLVTAFLGKHPALGYYGSDDAPDTIAFPPVTTMTDPAEAGFPLWLWLVMLAGVVTVAGGGVVALVKTRHRWLPERRERESQAEAQETDWEETPLDDLDLEDLEGLERIDLEDADLDSLFDEADEEPIIKGFTSDNRQEAPARDDPPAIAIEEPSAAGTRPRQPWTGEPDEGAPAIATGNGHLMMACPACDGPMEGRHGHLVCADCGIEAAAV